MRKNLIENIKILKKNDSNSKAASSRGMNFNQDFINPHFSEFRIPLPA